MMETQCIYVKSDCMWNENWFNLCHQESLFDDVHDFRTTDNASLNDIAMTNHQPNSSPIKMTLTRSFTPTNHNNSLAISIYNPLSKYDHQQSDFGGYLTTKDPLLTSANNANPILTHHNQDNGHLNNLDSSINSKRYTELVNCSNDLSDENCPSMNCNWSVVNDNSHHSHQTSTLNQNGQLMVPYGYSFETCLMDSHCSSPSSTISDDLPVNIIEENKMESLFNDHSYGTSSIEKEDSPPMMNHSIPPTKTKTRVRTKRPSGDLPMKNKHSKLKKVMDIDQRTEHNLNERHRRDILKSAFSNLASRCPKLASSNKKPSRIQTLNEASSFIRSLNDKNRSLKEQMELEKQRKAELEKKLARLLQHQM